jgi:hypothetical protein
VDTACHALFLIHHAAAAIIVGRLMTLSQKRARCSCYITRYSPPAGVADLAKPAAAAVAGCWRAGVCCVEVLHLLVVVSWCQQQLRLGWLWLLPGWQPWCGLFAAAGHAKGTAVSVERQTERNTQHSSWSPPDSQQAASRPAAGLAFLPGSFSCKERRAPAMPGQSCKAARPGAKGIGLGRRRTDRKGKL